MKLRTDFKIVYVPLPPEMIEIRRASLLLLLQWIKEDLLANPEPLEVEPDASANLQKHVEPEPRPRGIECEPPTVGP